MAVSWYSIVILFFISEELSNSYSCKFFEQFNFSFISFLVTVKSTYQRMFLYTFSDFELRWYLLQYVNKCWIFLYLIISSGLSATPTLLSLTFFFLPDYNLWLRLISQEFTLAIPRTYWVLDDEISNGQSLLPFVLVPKFLSGYSFCSYTFLGSEVRYQFSLIIINYQF